jgi:hypothetical protein
MTSGTHQRRRRIARVAATAALFAPLLVFTPRALAAAATTAQPFSGHLPGALAWHNGACLLPVQPAGLCGALSASAGTSASAPTAPSAALSPGPWTVVASPNLTGHLRDAIADVSCVTATDCWAVGDSRSAGDYSRPLTEHWDGSSWSLADAPQPDAVLNAQLTGVACTSSTDCLASGFYSVTGGNSFPFSLRWDGTSWSLLSTPYPAGEQFGGLRGVACAAPDDCWAVGWSYVSDYATLIEHWDGTSWSIATALSQAQLSAVTCAGTSACWAAGATEPSSGLSQPFVAQWDGTSWTPATVMAPPGDQDAELDGIACATSSVCWAVGRVQQLFVPGYQPLTEELSSGSWSVVTGGLPPTALGALEAAGCASATSCYAVGYATSSNGPAPLLEQWDGTAWTDASPAAPSGSVDSELDGVTCANATCWTVGIASVPDASNVDALLYQLQAGTWTQVNAPVPVGTQVNALGAVACVSSSACVAVGSHTDGAYALTLAESWDGSGWSVVTSPSVDGMDTFLSGVACVTATDCWAVGDAQDVSNTSASPVIDSWDGAQWRSVTAPAPTTAQITVLNGVTCTSSADCWAVGASLSSAGPVAGVEQTLIEHWDGTSWSIVSSPNNSPVDSAFLASVTCVSSSDCWAAGVTAGSAFSGLLEQWNGTQWQVVPSPQPPARSSGQGTPNGGLFGVTCVDAADCWAVGYSYLSNGQMNTDFETWVERWDGSAWSTVASPNPSPFPVDALFSVTCAAANDCWSVGTYGAPVPGGGVYETLTLHWDGVSWTWVDSPTAPGNTGQTLTGVTCLGRDGCWAVGAYNLSDGTLQTFVLTTAPVPPVPVPETPAAALLLLLPAGFLVGRRLFHRHSVAARVRARQIEDSAADPVRHR